MNLWKKISRNTFYLILLVGMLAGVSIPAAEQRDVRAAPMSANALNVIISEVAWSGTNADANDEWIELYNPTGTNIDLSGWSLRAADGTPNIGLSGVILSNGYFLLERSDNYTVSDIAADLTYTGAMGDAGEILRLYDNSATPKLIDTANGDGGAWPSGSVTPNRVSMERGLLNAETDASWGPNNGITHNGMDAGNPAGCTPGVNCITDPQPINGTPKQQNSIAVLTDLSLSITPLSTTAGVASSVSFILTIENNSSTFNATGVYVNVALAGLTLDSAVPSLGIYSLGVWNLPSLVNGSSATLTINATVLSSGTIDAQISSSDQTDLDASNNSVTASVTVPPTGSADLRLENSVNNSAPKCGQNIVFAIDVTNDGPDTATNVQVRDTLLPSEFIYVSNDRGATYSGNTVNWSIPSLLSNSTQRINITARLITNVPVTNWAEVFASDQLDSDSQPGNLPIDQDDSDDETVTPDPNCKADLSLSQIWSRSTTTAGRADLKITVTNNDPVNSATNVQVMDLLPDGLDYASYTSSLGTYTSSTGVWAVGTLPPNSSATLTIIVEVAASGTSTQNFAEVWQSDQFDPNSTPRNGEVGENDDTSYLGIPPGSFPGPEVKVADLRLSQTVDIAGSNAVFTITVRNDGPDDASSIVIKNSQLATGYSYVSHGVTTGTYNNATGEWTIPTLLDGQSATLTVTTAYAGSLPVNWAQVTAVNEVDPDSLPNNCSATITSCTEDDDAAAPAADLYLTHSVNNSNPFAGNDITFTITVTNAGIADTTGVQVKTLLPSGLTYLSHSQSLGSYNKSSGIWTVGALNAGASQTLSLTADVAKVGILTNTAEVWKSDQDDPDSKPANGSTSEDDYAAASTTTRLSIVINEIAWGGTAASADDEWMELYNPSSSTINLTGWTLKSNSGSIDSIDITLSGTLSAGGYFLLERGDNLTVSDVTANQIYSGALSDDGEVLLLLNSSGAIIDSVNGDGGAWVQGSAAARYNYASMERVGVTAESDLSWVTNTGSPRNGSDADGADIYGTPKKANSTGVTPTATAGAGGVPTAIPAVGRPIINEFLSRPGFDWNQDGKVDVFDEYIEIKNIGTADISVGGWKLDDEADQGSNPFILPTLTLKPGQYAIFYGLQTNILLSDGGDTVRLLDSSNKVYDAYTYAIAEVEDQSTCRLPDGNGIWYEDCVPTPNRINSREGEVPSMPEGEAFESPVCNLPDTLHPAFLFAECRGYGDGIWRYFFWDEFGWMGEHPVPENLGKRQSFVE